MFADMLGLGPLFKTLNDPNFKVQVETLVKSLVENAERTRRIEARLEELFPREAEKKSAGRF
jgi:hypothetical protein